MCKALCVAVALLVLVVGSTQAEETEPANGGTVSDTEHAVFLPVVEVPGVCVWKMENIGYRYVAKQWAPNQVRTGHYLYIEISPPVPKLENEVVML